MAILLEGASWSIPPAGYDKVTAWFIAYVSKPTLGRRPKFKAVAHIQKIFALSFSQVELTGQHPDHLVEKGVDRGREYNFGPGR
jgi:hypothetical protein